MDTKSMMDMAFRALTTEHQRQARKMFVSEEEERNRQERARLLRAIRLALQFDPQVSRRDLRTIAYLLDIPRDAWEER